MSVSASTNSYASVRYNMAAVSQARRDRLAKMTTDELVAEFRRRVIFRYISLPSYEADVIEELIGRVKSTTGAPHDPA